MATSVLCVTRDRKFKDTAKRIDISESKLEEILHEYFNDPTVSDKETYPDDSYILSKVRGNAFLADQNQVELWNLKYNLPIQANTEEEVNLLQEHLMQFFPKESIGVKPKQDGTFEVTVGEPVDQTELESIKSKAIADGTFMKAPNGKDSNLNERQWLQVRTKAFKSWFGDWEKDPANASKVVDENGEPLVVYHGGAPKISTFRVGSPETTTTGYGTYTEEGTGRKIPVDSARTIFFSSNPFVGQSYAQLYALQYFKDLHHKVLNMLDNLHDDVAEFSEDDFKSFDEFYDFLTIISEYNLRFAKLRDYIKELQQKGERLKPNEITAARQLFIDLRSVLEEYTKNWNLASSQWDNILTIGKDIIREYLGGEYYAQNIEKLLSGEIPAYLKKEWELFTKIRNHREKYGLPQIGNYNEVYIWLSSGQSFTDSDYVLKYSGKELILDETRGRRDVPISQMSFDEVRQFFQRASLANKYSFWERDADKVKHTYREKSGYYPVFLNMRNPFVHDYEGTHMGQGYKQNPKISFGYVAARQVDKAIRDGNDGVVYQNIYDPYLADNYGVFSPNQIKSAVNNDGTFTIEDNNIYQEGERLLQNQARDTRLDELIKKEDVSINDLLSLIDSSSEYSGIPELLRTKSEGLLDGIQVKLIEGNQSGLFNKGRAFYNTNDKTIYINTLANYRDGRADSVIMHEIMHAVTVNRILGNRAYRSEFDKIISEYQKHFYNQRYSKTSLNKEMASHYMEEFIADVWSNIDTINNLKNIKTNTKQTLWDRIKNFFTKIFKGSDGTLMAQASDAIYRLLDQPELVNTSGNYYEGETPEASTAEQRLTDTQSVVQQESPARRVRERIRPSLQDEFDRTVKQNKQINNLLNSDVITPTDISEAALIVSNWISEMLTKYQDNPELLFSNFTNLAKTNNWETEEDKKKDIDAVKKLSRKEIVEKIGIDEFLDRAKFEIFETGDFNDNETMEQADAIAENFKGLMTFVTPLVAGTEGFVLKTVRKDNLESAVDNVNDEVESDGVEPIDKETLEETIRDLTEHWAIESKTLDVYKTATQKVREALQQCYLLEEVKDKNGNPVLDENGNKTYKRVVNKFAQEDRVYALRATQSILHWVQGATNSQEMIQKLKAKADANPWITQIITKLEDRSGKEADFRSQFFKTFYKSWHSYYVQTVRNGKIVSMPVNETPALNGVIDRIKTNYNIGRHPLFTNSGIEKSRLAQLENKLTDFQKVKDKNGFDIINNDKDRRDNLAQALADTSYLLGYPVPLSDVQQALTKDNFNQMVSALSDIVRVFKKNANVREYNPFKFGEDSTNGFFRRFLSPLVASLEDIEKGSFYANSKMYQGYITPSYTTKVMNKLGGDQATFDKFILEEFTNTEWFVKTPGLSMEQLRVSKQSSIRNLTLQKLIAASEEDRKRFVGYKSLLNYNSREYMRDMTSSQYVMSVLTDFASLSGKAGETAIPAWYVVPIESNKPDEGMFKSYRFVGDNYKEEILRGMRMMFSQELSRIQTVMMRNLEKGDVGFIENFDGKEGNGRKFNFLPWMNDYLEGGSKADTAAGKEIQRKLRGDAKEIAKNPIKYDVIERAVNDETRYYFDKAVYDTIIKYQALGLYDNIKKIEKYSANLPPDSSKPEVDRFLENFVWNHIYAQNSYLQFMVTDLAFYKDSDDLQKRLAQLRSPGTVGDRDATDYNGNEVTDGKYRIFYVEDLEKIKANVVDNLRAYFEQKAAQIENSNSRDAYKAFAKSFLSNYDKFTVTDGQAFTTVTGLRKKSFINGNWSEEFEDIWQKFRDGKFNTSDLQTASQVKKNFTYSQIMKQSNVTGAPLQTLKFGVQHKDSEALLWMAYGIIGDTDTGRPNILRAIMRVMEHSHYRVFNSKEKRWYDSVDAEGKPIPAKTGIDTMVFHSGVKTGYMKGLDFNKFLEDPEGEAKAFSELQKLYDKNSPTGWNPLYVHEIAIEDVNEQLEVPAHFRDHENIWGSQERVIIPSAVETTFMGQDVVYEVKTPDGERQVNAKQFQNEYESVASQNIEDSIDAVCEELGLGKYYTTPEDRNYALSRVLRREIVSSPRYGSDLLIACSIDENTGDFRIPLGDSVQSKRVEQLINSIVKNNINKQQFKGGPSVLVTNWGRTKHLNIIFKDKSGKLLPVRSEWEKNNPGGDFDGFLLENQASVAWFECYASATTQDLFRNFMDADGFIDIESIEMLDGGEELLKMVGYRIPTEDMYSIAPFRIVGFLPKEVGDTFMQPWEMPAITGEDHDVDKKNLLRKELHITRSTEYRTSEGKENRKKLSAAILNRIPELQTNRGADLVDEFLSGDRKQPAETEEMRLIKKTYLNLMFKVTEPGVHFTDKGFLADGETRTEKRDARNNHIFNMTWSLLTNQASVDKVLNTGSFEPQKNLAYKVAAMRADPSANWSGIDSQTTEQLKKKAFKNKYLPNFLTQTDYYENNSVAGNVLGQAAVQRTAHAVLKNGGYGVVMPSGYSFVLAGQTFGSSDPDKVGFVPIDNEFSFDGESIGKTLGNHVGASADAVKDPVLNFLNINTNTFRTYAVMLRLGVPFRVAGLMTSSKAMSDALAEHKKRSLNRAVRLSTIIDEMLASLEETYGLENSKIRTEELSFDELTNALRPTEDAYEDARLAYKILTHWRDFEAMANAVQPLTVGTRYNSIASAVGPQVVDNKMQDYKANQANNENSAYKLVRPTRNPDGTIDYNNTVGTQDVLERHPILESFSKAYLVADELLKDMPVQSAGFETTRNVIARGLKDSIMRDRGLLLGLSDFYQSYLLIKNGVINPDNLNYFVNQFPKEFIEKGYKEKYAGNPFIDAIKPNTRGNKAGKEILILNIETSDMEAHDIDRIKLGWTQFHKQEPEVSRKLFEYNFAIGGIGFSPKTFMNCLPTEVKELIPRYIETFRKFPEITVVDAVRIVDQYVRNNWNENKLVPYIQLRNIKVEVKNGERTFSTRNPEFNDTPYFKTSMGGNDVMFKLKTVAGFGSDREFTFIETTPLGDNGAYLEISDKDIDTPLNKIGVDSPIPPRGEDNGAADHTNTPQPKKQSVSDMNRNIMELRQILKDSYGKPIVGEAFYDKVRRGDYKDANVGYQVAKGLVDTLNRRGIKADVKTLNEIRKRFC